MGSEGRDYTLTKPKPKESPMANPNFSSVLDRPVSSVERPPAMPIGTYVATIQGLPRRDKSSKKQTEFVEFKYIYNAPYKNSDGEGDVDEEALAEFEAKAGKIAGQEGKLTFYITEKSGYRLREFIEGSLLMESDDDDDTLWVLSQRTAGTQFLVKLRHKATDDGKGVFAEAESTAAVE